MSNRETYNKTNTINLTNTAKKQKESSSQTNIRQLNLKHQPHKPKLTPLSRFLFNKGCRVAIRGKVNEPLHTGLRVVDTILTLGKGQRQLIIGDRVSGKTSIYLNSILTQSTSNALFGNKRCFCV